MISYTYNSKSREELVSFAHGLAAAIDPQLSKRSRLPLVVCLRGDKNAGKSLFWDEIKEALLGGTARIDPSFSEDLATADRIYETWNGKHSLRGDPLKIFFCNIQSMFFYIEDDKNIRRQLLDLGTSEQNPRRFGDLLLISNGHINTSSLDVLLKRPTRSMSKMQSEWDRKTTITFHDPALENLPEFQELLTRHCEPTPQ